ncbi:O-antigen ligase family protein [Persicitalea sp.]|uniref:O-antigen ligase family protein n=1 Tax=Persicitalea sp. TaxID=3100273 RepID=UPI0035943408
MSPRAFIRRSIWEEKLLNPFGAGLLALLAVGVAWVVGQYGLLPGLLLVAAIVGIPTLYGTVAYPKQGIVILLVASFLLFYVIRMGIDFPVGTVMDGLEWLLVLGTILARRRVTGPSVFGSTIGFIILVWVLYTVLQVLNPWAASKMAWLYTVRTVGAVTLMYFVFVANIDSVKYLRMLIWLWIGLALVGALYGFKQELLGFTPAEFQELISDPKMIDLLFIDGHWRKYSIFSDPVAFAYNMVMVALICLSLIQIHKGFLQKSALILIALFCVVAMLFSGTRGGYVLIPAGFVLFFILRFNRTLLMLAAIGAFAFIILIKIPTGNPTLYRFQTAFRPTDDPSFNLRTYNQKRIQPYIQQHPFGGGLGATGVWGVRFAPDSFLASFPPDSGYVRVAVEMGWVGLLLFCTLIFIILKKGIDHFFLIRNEELKAYCLAMTIVVFVLGIGSYPQEAIVQFPSNILFYLAAAIIQVSLQLDATVAAPDLPEEERSGLTPADSGAGTGRNFSAIGT